MPNLTHVPLLVFISRAASHQAQLMDDALRELRDAALRVGLLVEPEVVDVMEDPELTEQHNVIATPTIVRLDKHPLRQLIGLPEPFSMLRLLRDLEEDRPI